MSKVFSACSSLQDRNREATCSVQPSHGLFFEATNLRASLANESQPSQHSTFWFCQGAFVVCQRAQKLGLQCLDTQVPGNVKKWYNYWTKLSLHQGKRICSWWYVVWVCLSILVTPFHPKKWDDPHWHQLWPSRLLDTQETEASSEGQVWQPGGGCRACVRLWAARLQDGRMW